MKAVSRTWVCVQPTHMARWMSSFEKLCFDGELIELAFIAVWERRKKAEMVKEFQDN